MRKLKKETLAGTSELCVGKENLLAISKSSAKLGID
jgi:hypothetical protein